jgi:TonB family protein
VVVYKKSEPSYTEAARSARLEGTVGIGLVVAEDGTPRDLHVIKSLGLGLDEKALEAVSTWLFRPSLLNGQPVPLPVVIEVNFRLDDSRGTFAQPHP